MEQRIKVNPSTPRPGGWGLLRVDSERRFFTPPSKAGAGAAERVNDWILEGREPQRTPGISGISVDKRV
jgi:hypothetical protein